MLCACIDEIGGADADDDADDRAPAAHLDFGFVRRVLVDQGAVDVIGPHGGEGADVARHSRHESGDQRGNAEAEQARSAVACQHQRQDFVITVQSLRLSCL